MSLWCGGCPFLRGGCLFVLRGGGWPSLLGPVLLSHAGGWSFLLMGCGWPFLVRVGLALLSWGSWWLALHSWGSGWPSLLGPVRLSHAGGWPFLLRVGVGLSFLEFGFGLSFLGCGGWPCLLRVGVGAFPCSSGVGLSFFGWELVLSLWCGGCPFLLEVRPGPPFSGPSVFLMLVVGPSFSGLGFGLSLFE